MKKHGFRICLVLLTLSLLGYSRVTSSAKDFEDPYTKEYESIYISDQEKAAWFDPLARLLSNQEELIEDEYGRGLGYAPPYPDRPSISDGWGIGLFDINIDGVPELVVDAGGGSSGCNLYYLYDIFSGEQIDDISGTSENDSWGLYYNLENDQYFPLGRYSYRGGWGSNSHFTVTVRYDETEKQYKHILLFFSRYYYEEYDGDEAYVEFRVNDEPTDSEGFQYHERIFYQENCLLPNTGIKFYDWHEVSDQDDSYEERAEKMARMLLYGSGQRFVRVDDNK